jgi:hypothetical protein
MVGFLSNKKEKWYVGKNIGCGAISAGVRAGTAGGKTAPDSDAH